MQGRGENVWYAGDGRCAFMIGRSALVAFSLKTCPTRHQRLMDDKMACPIIPFSECPNWKR